MKGRPLGHTAMNMRLRKSAVVTAAACDIVYTIGCSNHAAV
jgi:hypothetical protein